jgi:lysophospholipase L1-like esterase
MPLIKQGYLPALTADDIDPGSCRPKQADIFSTIGARASAELIPKLKDTGGNVSIGKMRVDPSLEVTNVAIGGFRVAETVDGAKSLFGTVLEHVVWDPKVDAAGLISAPAQMELDRVVALKPAIAITTDLFGNDYNNVNLYTDGVPDLGALTPVEEVRASLRTVISRLESTGAEVFVATGPDNTVLPAYAEKVARLKAAGFSEGDATGWLTAMRERIGAYNDVLREEAAGHPKIHVVDLHAKIAQVLSQGVVVEGETLQPAPFGGLLSMDSMHFSDTGYAVLANTFIEAINGELGMKIPLADLAAIHAEDPYSVKALKKVGLGCAGMSN